jgi:hypothetical protein
MASKGYLVSTPKLRNMMLKHMVMGQAISVRDLSAKILAKHPNAKAKPTNLDYHMNYLVKELYAKQVRVASPSPTHNSEFGYIKLKDNYVLPERRTVIEKKTPAAPKVKKVVNIVNPFRTFA